MATRKKRTRRVNPLTGHGPSWSEEGRTNSAAGRARARKATKKKTTKKKATKKKATRR